MPTSTPGGGGFWAWTRTGPKSTRQNRTAAFHRVAVDPEDEKCESNCPVATQRRCTKQVVIRIVIHLGDVRLGELSRALGQGRGIRRSPTRSLGDSASTEPRPARGGPGVQAWMIGSTF